MGRSGVVALLGAAAIGTILATAACAAGGEDGSAQPSPVASARSFDRSSWGEPEPSGSPSAATRTESPQPDRTREPTAAPVKTSTRPPVPAEPTTRAPAFTPPATTSQAPPSPSPSPSPSAVAATTGSGIASPFGWFVLSLFFLAAAVGGFLVHRSQRKPAWDTRARQLEAETRAVVGTRLSPVLTTATPSQRGLVWPPLRADLIALVNRWNGLVQRAPGERRRAWATQISAMLQGLVAAVEAENESLALGGGWMLLRPGVRQAQQALADELAVQPEPEPPAAGEPGPPAFQT
jgi:hypothetical protein